MEFDFGEKMKVLRKKRNLTQEQLSEIFGISFQAISKWETNAAYPDITMFPVIANFYGVTTDELLGVDVYKTRDIIKDLCDKVDSMFNEHKYSEALYLMRKATADYPGNEELQYRLAWALTGNKSQNPGYLDEAIDIYLRILENCTDTELRLKVTRDLMYRYYTKNDISTATTFVNQLPSFDVCREYTMGRSNLLEGNALVEYLKNNISLFGNAILECLEYMMNNKIITEEQIEPETRKSYKVKIELMKEVLEYGFD